MAPPVTVSSLDISTGRGDELLYSPPERVGADAELLRSVQTGLDTSLLVLVDLSNGTTIKLELFPDDPPQGFLHFNDVRSRITVGLETSTVELLAKTVLDPTTESLSEAATKFRDSLFSLSETVEYPTAFTTRPQTRDPGSWQDRVSDKSLHAFGPLAVVTATTQLTNVGDGTSMIASTASVVTYLAWEKIAWDLERREITRATEEESGELRRQIDEVVSDQTPEPRPRRRIPRALSRPRATSPEPGPTNSGPSRSPRRRGRET